MVGNDNIEEIYKRGIELMQLNRFQEAFECFQQLTGLVPTNKEFWLLKGRIAHQLGKFEDSSKSFEQVTNLDPNDIRAWLGKEALFNSVFRFEEAIACLDRVIAINPNSAEAWYRKGLNLTHPSDSMDYSKALACFERAIGLNPSHSDSWAHKGLCLIILKKPNEAIACFNRALELDPMNMTAMNNKAITLGNLGKSQEAKECYSEVKRLEEKERKQYEGYTGNFFFGSVFSLLYSEFYQRARMEGLWPKKGDLDGAIKLEETMLERLRNAKDVAGEAIALTNLGSLYFEKREYQSALRFFQDALEFFKKFGQIQLEWIVLEKVTNLNVILNQVLKAKEEVEQFLKRAGSGIHFYRNIYSEVMLKLGLICREFGMRERDRKHLDLSLTHFRAGFHNLEKEPIPKKGDKEYEENMGLRSSFLRMVGDVEAFIGNYDIGLLQFFDALKIQTELAHKNEVMQLLGYIGDVYRLKGEPTKSLGFLSEAVKIAKEQNQKIELIRIRGCMAIIYLQKGEFEEGIKCYQENIALAQEMGDKNAEACFFHDIAVILIQQQKLKEAPPFLEKAIYAFNSNKDINLVLREMNYLSEIYHQIGDFNSEELCKKKVAVIYKGIKDGREDWVLAALAREIEKE